MTGQMIKVSVVVFEAVCVRVPRRLSDVCVYSEID